ncbi:uncharacterized protein PAC_04320 [Phialocephala subalpina]|uniref:Uncharacterized protein n=1 Tax=Phialocephala subalpina TaxID=576137 RepID=A0A1L7WNT8_9HELO|nr:uncharacterized protein PAC_04320 [Phialocephala subalpina]
MSTQTKSLLPTQASTTKHRIKPPTPTMASFQGDDYICNLRDHTNFPTHHLSHTQQKEEYLIAQYSDVLDALQKLYLKISHTLLAEIEGTFEADVLEEVLDYLRETMKHNEHCLNEARWKLWAKYQEDGVTVVGGGGGGKF